MSEEEDLDRPAGDPEPPPSQPTEEYLLGGLDEPISSEGQESEPEPKQDVEPSSAEPPQGERRPAADSDEDFDPPTEEVFAVEAQIAEGEDVPELDPVFRAALLESPESAASPTTSTPPAESADEPDAEDDGGGADPEPADSTAEETSDHEIEDEGPVTEEQTAILAAAAKSEVHQVVDAARQTGQPWDPARPPASGDFSAPPKRRRYWWRFSLATLIIVFSFAGATSASVLNIFDDLTERLSDPAFENLSENVLPSNNGGPQTIAILGSDARTGGGAPEGDKGRSDTTILLRLDPDSDQIAMLSIPRDLEVEIPGVGGTDRFNAAYSYGGTKLTLKTIKQVTGLDVNHVINVDFQGFAEVVDAIGCVFIDVDRDYFNSNEGKAIADMFAEIDIDAGYQKLCGPDALEFARYRHTDTDLVRSSRQQDLLGEVRNRLSFGEIIDRRNELIDAFTENTRSDISGSKEALELLKLLFDSRNARVVEVKFPATLGESYVTSTPQQIQGAVDKFLGFEDAEGPVGTLAEGSRDKRAGKNRGKKKAGQDQNKAIVGSRAPGKEDDGLVDAAQDGLDMAIELQAGRRGRKFDIYYTKRLPAGTVYADGSRTYHMRDPDKTSHAAYRMVMALQQSYGLHYFGIQGIRGWQDPPILEAPHEEMKIDGRDFRVYSEGDRIRMVAWFDDGNTYWISNSLLLTLTNEQMLGMARATRAFTPG